MPRPARAIPAPDLKRLDEYERAAFDQRWEFLQRFVGDHQVKLTPAALRSGYTAEAFAALSLPDRAAVLRGAAVADVLSGRVRVVRPKVEAAPGSTPAPVLRPAAPTKSPRYVVPCSGATCDRMVPARGPRPVVAYCEADRRAFAERAAKRQAARAWAA